jgi:hypothetical protein
MPQWTTSFWVPPLCFSSKRPLLSFLNKTLAHFHFHSYLYSLKKWRTRIHVSWAPSCIILGSQHRLESRGPASTLQGQYKSCQTGGNYLGSDHDHPAHWWTSPPRGISPTMLSMVKLPADSFPLIGKIFPQEPGIDAQCPPQLTGRQPEKLGAGQVFISDCHMLWQQGWNPSAPMLSILLSSLSLLSSILLWVRISGCPLCPRQQWALFFSQAWEKSLHIAVQGIVTRLSPENTHVLRAVPFLIGLTAWHILWPGNAVYAWHLAEHVPVVYPPRKRGI